MSFAAAVKDDLARVEANQTCCKLAEFAAFLRIGGHVHISGRQEVALSLTTEHPAAARRVFALAKEVFALQTEIVVHRKTRLRKNQVYDIRVPAQTGLEQVFRRLGLMGLDQVWQADFPGPISPQVLRRDCCRRAYLRGSFLAGGSINDPSGEYHLEIACTDGANARLVVALLDGFGIPARSTRRKQNTVVYLKESEAIADTLNVMGSHRSLLEFENTRIVKDVRNQVNRQTNCENANLNKTVAAGLRQAEEIRTIDRLLGLEKLPEALEEAARARLDNPDCSLADLGELLGVGRSGVNHRLRRLTELARQLRQAAGEEEAE